MLHFLFVIFHKSFALSTVLDWYLRYIQEHFTYLTANSPSPQPPILTCYPRSAVEAFTSLVYDAKANMFHRRHSIQWHSNRNFHTNDFIQQFMQVILNSFIPSPARTWEGLSAIGTWSWISPRHCQVPSHCTAGHCSVSEILLSMP